VECYCCGETRDASALTSLHCHDEVKLCRDCIGWLNRRAGGVDVTPTLPVSDMAATIEFYESAGFDVERYDDGFAFVRLDDQSVFDLGLAGGMTPSSNRAGCYVMTADVDDWHARFAAAGLPVTPVEDMPWGMHEFTLTDPSGNRLRVGRPTPTAGQP
jgi:predicted enzyme related to lactoylglutathione lyase